MPCSNLVLRRPDELPIKHNFIDKSRTTEAPRVELPTPTDDEVPSTTSPPASPWTCPHCGGPMIIVERLTAPPDCSAFSTRFSPEGFMKSWLSFPEGLWSSVPTLLVCPDRLQIPLSSDSSPSHPSVPTLQAPLQPRFATTLTPPPPSTTFPFGTFHILQTP